MLLFYLANRVWSSEEFLKMITNKSSIEPRPEVGPAWNRIRPGHGAILPPCRAGHGALVGKGRGQHRSSQYANYLEWPNGPPQSPHKFAPGAAGLRDASHPLAMPTRW